MKARHGARRHFLTTFFEKKVVEENVLSVFLIGSEPTFATTIGLRLEFCRSTESCRRLNAVLPNVPSKSEKRPTALAGC